MTGGRRHGRRPQAWQEAAGMEGSRYAGSMEAEGVEAACMEICIMYGSVLPDCNVFLNSSSSHMDLVVV